MGQRQYLSTYDRKKEFDSSPAIMDMYASARPKVYAIIQLIRRHENIVDIINERYKIQTYEHSIQDQVNNAISFFKFLYVQSPDYDAVD